MLPRRQRRIANSSYRGERFYFVTVLTKRRERFFEDAQLAGICAAQCHRAAERSFFLIRAGTIMPDHAHLLVAGLTAKAYFIAFMKLAKQLSGYHVKRVTSKAVWSDGYYDRVVRQDEDPRRYIDYILSNPVRAGLADTVGVHPHTWSSEDPQ